jgi:hypothetical protein
LEETDPLMPTDGKNSFDLTGGELLILKKGQSLPTNDLCQSELWFSNLLILSIPDEGYSRNMFMLLIF